MVWRSQSASSAFPMSGAVKWRELASLPRDRHHLPGGDMVIDEEHLDPLANGEVRRLAERGRQLHGDAKAAVVVIGDTPRDVDAAHAIGAVCVAVATGRFTVEELATHKPMLAVKTLADPEARAVLYG